MAPISYALCAITGILCFVLLLRGYSRDRSPLLLWSSLCFCCIAIQNILLFADLVLIPEISLAVWRALIGLLGLTTLLCALIWERRWT